MKQTWLVVFDATVPREVIEEEVRLVMNGAALTVLSEIIEDDEMFDLVFDEEMDYLQEWIPAKMKMAYDKAFRIGDKLVYALTLDDGFLDRALIEIPDMEHIKWHYCKRQKVFLT